MQVLPDEELLSRTSSCPPLTGSMKEQVHVIITATCNNTINTLFLFSHEHSSNEIIISYYAEYSFNFFFFLKTLTKSLNGCFSGISHSSLIVMYLKQQCDWLHSVEALLIRILRSTGTHDSCTHLSKSVKRLTLKVCCLSSLYPSAFFTASTA